MSAFRMTLDGQLEKLESAQLVRRADDPEIAYLFRHTLTQETAYHSLLQKRRREVHRRVAEAYERAFADDLHENAAVLVQHYSEAGDDTKTLAYAVMAGDAAARVYANEEAISYFSRALEIAKKVLTNGPSPLRELYVKRGRALEVGNRHAEAFANYQEMEKVGQERADRSLVMGALIARATLHSITTPLFDPVRGQELSDRALALAREMADREAEAKILWNLMLLSYFTSRPGESVSYGEQSLAIARDLGLREQLAFTLSDISRSYAAAGQMERALDTQTEARGLLRELGDLPLLADNLSNSAGFYLGRGELDLARTLAEEALQTSHSIGNAWGEVYAEMILSQIHFEVGRIGDGIKLVEHSTQTAEQIGALFGISFGYAILSWVCSSLGDSMRAFELAQQGVAKADQSMSAFLPLSYAVLANAYLGRGDLAQAQLLVVKSHEHFDPINFDSPQPYFVMIVDAHVAQAMGESVRALQILDELITIMQQIGVPLFVAEAFHLKSQVLYASGKKDEARAALIEARASAESLGKRASLVSILSSLSRIEMDSGNEVEARLLRSEAREHVHFVLHNLETDLREMYLKLPDVAYVLDIE